MFFYDCKKDNSQFSRLGIQLDIQYSIQSVKFTFDSQSADRIGGNTCHKKSLPQTLNIPEYLRVRKVTDH